MSLCSRMPVSVRPVSVATTACPASWQTVTSIRTAGHANTTAARAAAARPSETAASGSGWVTIARRHTSAKNSTPPVSPGTQTGGTRTPGP